MDVRKLEPQLHRKWTLTAFAEQYWLRVVSGWLPDGQQMAYCLRPRIGDAGVCDDCKQVVRGNSIELRRIAGGSARK